MEKVPKPVSSALGFIQTILALDALDGVSDVVFTAHADKIRMAIIFELNYRIPQPHSHDGKGGNKGQ